MSDLGLIERDRYVSDGSMRWSRLAGLLIIPTLVAVIVAFLLNWLFEHGWYMVVLVPCIAAGALGVVMYACIGWAHCRKPFFAAFLGLTVGLVAYAGQFQFNLISVFGPGVAHRVDLLPGYISFRMATDVQADVGREVKNGEEQEADVGMNWFGFAYELLIVIAVPFEAARRRASNAYDSKHQTWMQKESLRFPYGTYALLEQALTTDRLTQFSQTHRPIASANQQNVCTLTLEYSEVDTASPLECPIYLSASERPIRDWMKGMFARGRLISQKQMDRGEALELQPLFPQFDRLLRARHQELRELPTEVPGVAGGLAMAGNALAGDTSMGSNASHLEPGVRSAPRVASEAATIVPLSEQDQVHFYSGKHLLMENLAGGAPLVLLAIGGGMIYAATLVWESWGSSPAIAIGCVGVILGLIGIYLALACPYAMESLYVQRLMDATLGQRSGHWVQPNDPGAFAVALTKRENWQSVKLEVSTDAGLAVIDQQQQELRMECGLERFRIPFGSLIDCQPELFQHPIDQNTEHWMVRLIVQTDSSNAASSSDSVGLDQREILFSSAETSWSYNTNAKRRQEATDICQQLCGGPVMES